MTPYNDFKTLTNIREWTPAEGDTLSNETYEKFVKSFEQDAHAAYKDSGTGSYYYFMGHQPKYQTDGTVKNLPLYNEIKWLCHSRWTGGHSSEFTDGFLNIFPNNLRPEINSRFYNFLFDKDESPFKEALKTCVILRDPKKDMFPHGLMWTNSEGCDIRLFTSLLIATRLCSGWALDIVWDRLVAFGFTPREALSILPLFNWDNMTVTGSTSPIERYSDNAFAEVELNSTGPWASDQPFGNKLNKESRWDNFSPQKVINCEPTYHEGLKTSKQCRPNPCNYLWNGDKPFFRNSLRMESEFRTNLVKGKCVSSQVNEIREMLNNGVLINWHKVA